MAQIHSPSLSVFRNSSFVRVSCFGLSRAAGDPRHIFLTEYTSQEDWDLWGEEYGLGKPFIVQYGIWVGNALRGDLEPHSETT
ncbi:MAG: hypothetical protein CM1200mP39_11830 [Dehalococcoidia bacterium]|nr:MAG: hypothetical protein CM1200mP39_11830 [Dehalococcoidia bacterium]